MLTTDVCTHRLSLMRIVVFVDVRVCGASQLLQTTILAEFDSMPLEDLFIHLLRQLPSVTPELCTYVLRLYECMCENTTFNHSYIALLHICTYIHTYIHKCNHILNEYIHAFIHTFMPS